MIFNPFLHSANSDVSDEHDFGLNQDINDNIMQCGYYDEETFKQEISKRVLDQPYLVLLHLNIRSLMNKVEDLQQYLADIGHNFTVIGISEMWLDNNTELYIQLPNYSFINTNRKMKTGGGVGMFISSSINYSARADLNLFKEDILESIFIEASIGEKEKIIIGTIYKPPNNNYDDFEIQLKSILHKIDKEKKTCILMEDFNIDLLKYEQNNNANRFIHQMYSSHFYPVINKPTRISTNTATIIDNIFINNIDLNCMNGILINDLSDHLPVFQILPLISIENKPNKSYMKQVITKGNLDKMKEKIQYTDWDNLTNTVDDAYKYFQDIFLNLYNSCIPEKQC